MQKLICPQCDSQTVFAECDERFMQSANGEWVKLNVNLEDIHFMCQEGHRVLVAENVVDQLIALANNAEGSSTSAGSDAVLGRLDDLAKQIAALAPRSNSIGAV